MSKVFNMVGGGGGPAASIFVTGLSETDTVTATNGVKTLNGEWDSGRNGFMIKKIRDFGTWTVTATNGEKTATQDVMVDVITEYEIAMDYSIINTDFSVKESSWSVVGGTLNFGNGLYVEEGWNGTLESQNVEWTTKCAYLEIPIKDVNSFVASWTDYVNSTVNGLIGGVLLQFLNGSTESFAVVRADAWGATVGQLFEYCLSTVGNEIFRDEYNNLGVNGATILHSISFDNGNVVLSDNFNGGHTVNFTANTTSVDKVRVWFISQDSNHKSPFSRIDYLKIE